MAGSHRIPFAPFIAVALGALVTFPAGAAAAPAARPTPPAGPVRLGFCGGDDWEPELAHQGSYVYVVITHYAGATACDPASGAPNSIDIQVSTDGGRTFGPPTPVFTAPIGGVTYTRQADPVVAVDASGAVYVAYLGYGVNGGHTDVVVAKSTDHGATFPTATKANAKDCKNCDHEKLVVAGSSLYLAYSQASYHYLTMSSNGGATWTQAMVLSADRVAFAESAVADAAGNVYVAWADCQSSNCTGVPAVTYRVSRTTAGTLSTTFSIVAYGAQGPACPFQSCGFAYFGAQSDLAIDPAGTLYLLYQDGQVSTVRASPPILWLARSSDAGATWGGQVRADDKTASGCAGSACYALFPEVTAGAAGSVAVAWMDDRNGSPIDHLNGWNVWLRSSTNSGASFGASQQISAFDPAQAQSRPNGFVFPYGDYFGLEVNGCGSPMLTWGEGLDWAGGSSSPGHIEFRSLC